MRTEKSIKNVIVAIISNIILIVIGFVSQLVFKECLGKEYLGLNGLFTSVVSMLGIVELGLGSALIYHLYKPVAENDINKIIALMRFYRISYRIIAVIILCLGAVLMPFLNFFVDTKLDINIYYVFALFVIECSFSYLLSYKRSILYANQENYIVNVIHLLYVLSMNICQVVLLCQTRDYILFLWVKVLFRIIENIVVTIVANKRYEYIKSKSDSKIDDDTKSDIIVKVKGLFIHKIGSYLVLGTDNIIISKFINLSVVGMYTSYTLITAGIKNLFSQMFYSITASVGNLLVLDKDRAFSVYKKMLFMNFWLSTFCSISFYFVSKPFVQLWLGNDYVLSDFVVTVMMINLFFDTYGFTIGAFKSAAGIFHEDRWIPALQSVINIVVSIVMVWYWGLAGVILGTIMSQMLLYLYSYPKFIYKKVFDKKNVLFYIETLKNFCMFILIYCVTLIISKIICVINPLTDLFVKIIICVIIPNLLLFLVFKNSEEFNYFISVIEKNANRLINYNKNNNSI